ncbi:hypothetical protein G4Y79_17560 [Phototrophicus methaneseepsis]|uniref:Uncharacterized protein n=1 Tax=Phototrophicus methaneseepsis TaxID=2710758 RepID=A0A7S8E6Z1_9CHLR|nr:hypothetical protein [Phototrophicus methaneseepsis]QPC81485.1 hypothetical protein G4Y79_17560 [Phototrophicus methaneseepsis]
MERTVPRRIGDEIQLYMRTYYSLLRSSHPFDIETLEESHMAMNSSLHVNAGELDPDMSAFLYAALRLPYCILDVKRVWIGQTERSFVQAGYEDIAEWERVYAPGRRRRMQFDGKSTLVAFIASRSDIDDLVPILVAFQMEWNKLHMLLQDSVAQDWLLERAGQQDQLSEQESTYLATALHVSVPDLRRLEIVWQGHLIDTLLKVSQYRKDMSVGLISGSLSDYRRATASWWSELCKVVAEDGIDPEDRPVYFVSSNTHSIVNLITGYARRHETGLVEYIENYNYESLLAEYQDIQRYGHKSLENFLYYVLGKYLQDDAANALERVREAEHSVGIYRVPNKHGFQIEAQIIDMGKLNPVWLDPRLRPAEDASGLGISGLGASDALIINIDYPLGMAGFEILSRISERVAQLLGVYVMGKAATLNGRVGDVMIPNVVHDEHSQNTYLFDNCFSADDVKRYMTYGNTLDNQKAVTALGTFLQNQTYMSVFYREGYTDIEMESGPYLSAIYEAFRPKRHPNDEIVNMYQVPFDIGFLHYASDTPMKHGQNLGAINLAYMGVEPTYATAIAILRRIFSKEIARLSQNMPTMAV